MIKFQTTKGFTLTELIIIACIFILLTTISISVFHYFQKESDLSNSTEEIINTLRQAQSKTITSEEASQYGVYFENTTSPHKYILFKGSSYALRDISADEVYILPKAIEIYAISLGTGKEVVFDRIDGETANAGSIALRLILDPTKSKTIYIDNSGQVGLTETTTPSDSGRIRDSRHAHFELGWSIRNATAIKFYFPDASQTETNTMAGYFNADKTVFDWSGSFSVGGVDQVFRIHTHYLDAFTTSLCLHRDRNNGKNNQEVIIYIVDGGADKDIAHYLADTADTLNKGSYVDTLQMQ